MAVWPEPGDVLLYSRNGFFSRAIRLKTWSVTSHCEVAISQWRAVASRDGLGVDAYDISEDGLCAVLRPRAKFDLDAAMAWFETVRGQGYDWLGLFAFFVARWQGCENGRMFCSEFATRFLRAGGIELFNGYDADGIAPGEFMKADVLRIVWRNARR